MFDLDQQIDRWKSAFAKKAECSSDELQELESHLREDIAALVAAGRSEQEAFSESLSRLGDPTEICGEFAKNESRFLWDGVALRGNRVMVILAGLAAALFGLAVWLWLERMPSFAPQLSNLARRSSATDSPGIAGFCWVSSRS
jgi:hypothetical protein